MLCVKSGQNAWLMLFYLIWCWGPLLLFYFNFHVSCFTWEEPPDQNANELLSMEGLEVTLGFKPQRRKRLPQSGTEAEGALPLLGEIESILTEPEGGLKWLLSSLEYFEFLEHQTKSNVNKEKVQGHHMVNIC